MTGFILGGGIGEKDERNQKTWLKESKVYKSVELENHMVQRELKR